MFAWIKRNLLVVLILLAVMGGAGLYVGITIADQPFFCGLLCHEMQPHVDSFRANFHGKSGKVVCMDCHAVPGFWHHVEDHVLASVFVIPHITKVYLEDEQNIHANVPEFNKEEMNFKGKTPKEEKELFAKCKVCHPNRLEFSYFMKVPEDKHTIITNNCKRCHPAIANQREEDTAKAKAALYQEGMRAPRGMPNVHPLHLGMNVHCNKCHNRVVHNVNPAESPKAMHDCTGCHNGTDAPFGDCKMCHVGIKKIFEGNSGRGVDVLASPMADINCPDCHNAEKKYKVNAQACVDCHGDEEHGQKKINELQGAFNENLTKVTALYEASREKIDFAQRRGKDVSPVVSIFKEGEYNYKLAKLDASHGVHNPEHTKALLEAAEHTFTEVKNMLATAM
ncbi:MAG: NapC/NirT family cytochrome c [Candidatus Schekmanbacteria bacterium]|nr:NapC/NirT family cytochrome c [Candidatus Schekmanbacteria bacterium]